MKRHSRAKLLLLLYGGMISPAVGRLPGQSGPAWERLRQLEKDQAKLDVKVKLDRELYFPGEDAHVALTVVNTTPGILEVPTPFDRETGGVVTMAPGNGPLDPPWVVVSLGFTGHGPVVVPREPVIPPTTWLPPGHPLEKAFWLSEAGCRKLPFVGPCEIEEKEGEYRLAFGYGAFAPFRVVWPQFEQWTEVVLAKPYTSEEELPNKKRTGRILSRPRRVRAMVLGYQGTHFLAVSSSVLIRDPRMSGFDGSGRLNGPASRNFSPYRRVATSSSPITAVRIEADNSENITIYYTIQTGQQLTLKLNAKRVDFAALRTGT